MSQEIIFNFLLLFKSFSEYINVKERKRYEPIEYLVESKCHSSATAQIYQFNHFYAFLFILFTMMQIH